MNRFERNVIETGYASFADKDKEEPYITVIGGGSVFGKPFLGQQVAEKNLQQVSETFWQGVRFYDLRMIAGWYRWKSPAGCSAGL